jgi:hypothetical protein
MERSDCFLIFGEVGIQLLCLRQSSFREELVDAICLKGTEKVSLNILKGEAYLLLGVPTRPACKMPKSLRQM